MGKRHRQSVLKKRDEKHGKKSVETGHDAKHEVSVTKKVVKKKYQRTGLESVKTCDVMLLSQSDMMGEVTWDNNSPSQAVQVDQTDISDLVKRFTAEGSSQASDDPPGTPPLVSMWMDSPGEEGSMDTKTPLNKTRRRKIRRPKKHPLLKKEVFQSSDILSKLAEVLQSEKSKEEEKYINRKSAEAGNRQGSEKSEETCTSTQDIVHVNVSTPLQTANISPILQVNPEHHLHRHTGTLSPVEQSHAPKSLGLCDTPKGTLKHTSVGCYVGTPTGAKHNCSSDDLWTDEELFENDSFLRATQIVLDGSPSPRIASKRKLATPVREKKRQTLQSDVSPVSEKSQGNSHEMTANNFKRPHSMGNAKVETSPAVSGEGLFKVPSSVPNTGSASVLKETNNIRCTSVSQKKVNFVNTKTMKANGITKIQTHSKQHLEDQNKKCHPKTDDTKFGGDVHDETKVTVNDVDVSGDLSAQTKMEERKIVTRSTAQTYVIFTSQEGKSPLHSTVSVAPPTVKNSNKENSSKSVHFGSKSCLLSTELSSKRKGTESVSELDLSMSEELLTMLAEPDNILDSQVSLFNESACVGKLQINDQGSEQVSREKLATKKNNCEKLRNAHGLAIVPGRESPASGNLGDSSGNAKDNEIKPVTRLVQKLKTGTIISASQEALFEESGLSDSLLEQSVSCAIPNDNSEALFTESYMFSESQVTVPKCQPVETKINLLNIDNTNQSVSVRKLSEHKSKENCTVIQSKTLSDSSHSSIITRGASCQYKGKTNAISEQSVSKLAKPSISGSNDISVHVADKESNVKFPKSGSMCVHSNNASFPTNKSAISSNVISNKRAELQVMNHQETDPNNTKMDTVIAENQCIKTCNKKPTSLHSSAQLRNFSSVQEKDRDHYRAEGRRFRFSRTMSTSKQGIDRRPVLLQRSCSGSSTETLCSSSDQGSDPSETTTKLGGNGCDASVKSASNKVTGLVSVTCPDVTNEESNCDTEDAGNDDWLGQEELLELLEKAESQSSCVDLDAGMEQKYNSSGSFPHDLKNTNASANQNSTISTGKNMWGKPLADTENKAGESTLRGPAKKVTVQKMVHKDFPVENIQSVNIVAPTYGPTKSALQTPTPVTAKQQHGGKSTKTLTKYPSFDSLNTQASPKTVVQSSLSSSQDSSATQVQKYSPQEIERKRQDALRKRQSRLKLAKPKR